MMRRTTWYDYEEGLDMQRWNIDEDFYDISVILTQDVSIQSSRSKNFVVQFRPKSRPVGKYDVTVFDLGRWF